ncbi:hypothetical protein L7F22_001253 [Adiantum nelumboides]|nr:hypothetical protein [Adiantum nelumboides]
MIEEQVVEADEQVVLIDLDGPIDKEDIEDAKINCKVGKEESKEPKMELTVLQVCSMADGGDSQVGAKLLKEVCVWWLKGMVITVALEKTVKQIQDFLEEDFTLYGWKGGHDMFNTNGDVHSKVGGAFGGVFLEMGSLSMDPGSNESMPMATYVDGWLDAQLAEMVELGSGPVFTDVEDPEDCLKPVGSNWRLLLTGVRSNQYFKVSKLLECLHPRIREKVEDGTNTYEDKVYLAKVKSQKIKQIMELSMLNPLEYVHVVAVAECLLVRRPKAIPVVQNAEPIKVRPMVDYVPWRYLVCDAHVPRLNELIRKEELHVHVNQEAKTIADIGVRVQLKEIKHILVECLHERLPKCSHVANIKDLEASEENMIEAHVQEEQRTEQADVHDEDQVERSRSTCNDKQVKLVYGAMVVAMLVKAAVECAIVVQQVQSFAKKNRVAMHMEENEDDAIEKEFQR